VQKSDVYLYSPESFTDVCRANHISFLVLQLANWKLEVELGSLLIITELLQTLKVVLLRVVFRKQK